MKQLILAVSALSLLIAAHADEPQGPDKKASFIIGHQIGSNLKRDSAPVDLDEILRGMQAAMDGKPVGFEPAEMQEIMTAFGQRITALHKDQAKGYLDAFAKEDGVKKTKSGLLYKVITEGKGESPKATDKVKVHYSGTLTSGMEFDSSYKRGEPAEFPVNQVIKGWTEALQMMKPGSKWKLVIPSDLAYGPRGKGRVIGPDETLVFVVELLEVL